MPDTVHMTPRLTRLRQALSTENRSSANDQVEATVGVLLLDESGPGPETLLIQRTQRHDDPWSGQVGFPGGRVKKTDVSTRAALHREVLEEVGIDLSQNGEEIGPLSLGHPMRRTEMRVQPWVYGLKQRPSVKVGPEVTEAFWVSLLRLPSETTMAQVEVRGEERTVESFFVEGRVVWGYTYRVLAELLRAPGVLDKF